MTKHLLVIGGSLGGLDAAKLVLSELEPSFPDPVLVVLHRARTSQGQAMTRSVEQATELPVCEAEDKMSLKEGRIHIAPADYHLFIEGGMVTLSFDEPVRFSRPSIDVAFESVALCYGSRTIGVVLSGSNADGSIGAAAISDAGGRVFVQDPSTAPATEMPEAAIAAVPAARVLSAAKIGKAINDLRRSER
ncbi:MAG: chemotaxis protein CheB [Acidobacteria bacterium]|nr:chemotaxis protein CheB [Acidobacteriota bacterium]